jgi:hypothetical protein
MHKKFVLTIILVAVLFIGVLSLVFMNALPIAPDIKQDEIPIQQNEDHPNDGLIRSELFGVVKNSMAELENSIPSLSSKRENSGNKRRLTPKEETRENIEIDLAVTKKTTEKDQINTPVESENIKEEVLEKVKEEIFISIIGPPEIGIILKDTKLEISSGDSAFDALMKVGEEKALEIHKSGFRRMVYVRGIADIYEFDYGPKSGWVYRINGEIKNIGSGAMIIEAGDRIEWLYTLDLGRDL